MVSHIHLTVRSLENILLYEEIIKFQTLTSEEKYNHIIYIQKTFFSHESFYEINLIAECKKKFQNLLDSIVKRELTELKNDILAPIKTEIEFVMKDSFYRFKNTPLFEEACQILNHKKNLMNLQGISIRTRGDVTIEGALDLVYAGLKDYRFPAPVKTMNFDIKDYLNQKVVQKKKSEELNPQALEPKISTSNLTKDEIRTKSRDILNNIFKDENIQKDETNLKDETKMREEQKSEEFRLKAKEMLNNIFKKETVEKTANNSQKNENTKVLELKIFNYQDASILEIKEMAEQEMDSSVKRSKSLKSLFSKSRLRQSVDVKDPNETSPKKSLDSVDICRIQQLRNTQKNSPTEKISPTENLSPSEKRKSIVYIDTSKFTELETKITKDMIQSPKIKITQETPITRKGSLREKVLNIKRNSELQRNDSFHFIEKKEQRHSIRSSNQSFFEQLESFTFGEVNEERAKSTPNIQELPINKKKLLTLDPPPKKGHGWDKDEELEVLNKSPSFKRSPDVSKSPSTPRKKKFFGLF